VRHPWLNPGEDLHAEEPASESGQLPLPLPEPEEARRMTRELLARIERDRQPARPVPWLLPLPEPAPRRERSASRVR
jgi:hypothetical protein